MNALHPVADRIRALVPMLASDQDGEVLAAARTLNNTLRGVGADLHDLAKLATDGPPQAHSEPARRGMRKRSGWRSTVRYCAINADRLGKRDADFVASMEKWVARGKSPTPKQADWLTGIYERLRGAGHA